MNFGKKCLLLAGLPVLMSCGESTIAGTYGFQLGKETGTHFGASLVLSDDEFPSTKESGLKKFDLFISIKNGTDDDSTFANILSYFQDESGDTKVLGYYKDTGEKTKSGENLLIFGLDFKYIYERFADVYQEMMGTPTTITMDDLEGLNNSKVINNLLISTYAKETVNMLIPVSVQDAILQLYWYGVDVRIDYANILGLIASDGESEQASSSEESSSGSEKEDEGSLIEVYDVPKHEPGTLPTAEDVEEINKTYTETHKTCYVSSFRIFHQVKLGLSKK